MNLGQAYLAACTSSLTVKWLFIVPSSKCGSGQDQPDPFCSKTPCKHPPLCSVVASAEGDVHHLHPGDSKFLLARPSFPSSCEERSG